MSEHDERDQNDDWLDGLAGRTTSSPLGREGEALRRVMRARDIPEIYEPDTDMARENLLLRKAGEEGESGRQDTSTTHSRRLIRPVWALAATLLLGVSLATVWQFTSPYPTPETLRSPRAGHGFLLVVDDPIATRLSLAEALFDVGVDLQVASLLGDELITADLPQPLPAELAEVLARFGIPIPEGGQLAVRIAAREVSR